MDAQTNRMVFRQFHLQPIPAHHQASPPAFPHSCLRSFPAQFHPCKFQYTEVMWWTVINASKLLHNVTRTVTHFTVDISGQPGETVSPGITATLHSTLYHSILNLHWQCFDADGRATRRPFGLQVTNSKPGTEPGQALADISHLHMLSQQQNRAPISICQIVHN